jgi:signal transduction histidine kinase
MAHEINNPLAGILQNTQVALNRITADLEANHALARSVGVDFGRVRGYMERRGVVQCLLTIREAGMRAARIVENMLCFSRRDKAHFAPHHLGEILEKALEITAQDYRREKGFPFACIRVTREFDPCLPQVMCEGSTLQQVFINILSNGADAMACRYGDPGNGSPECGSPEFVIKTRQEGCVAFVDIQDNGPGMREEDRKRVFEPFFTTKELGFGTGLGLSLSRFIVTRNHGGTLDVSSTPGRGTTFTVGIPIRET